MSESAELTPLECKQAAARERHSGKPRTRIVKDTESSIGRLLATLDSVTRADLKEKLVLVLATALNHLEELLAHRAAVLTCKTRYKEASASKIRAVADKQKYDLRVARERKRIQRTLNRHIKEEN